LFGQTEKGGELASRRPLTKAVLECTASEKGRKGCVKGGEGSDRDGNITGAEKKKGKSPNHLGWGRAPISLEKMRALGNGEKGPSRRTLEEPDEEPSVDWASEEEKKGDSSRGTKRVESIRKEEDQDVALLWGGKKNVWLRRSLITSDQRKKWHQPKLSKKPEAPAGEKRGDP